MTPVLILLVSFFLAQEPNPPEPTAHPLSSAELVQLQQKAGAGDAAAQNRLGVVYRQGLGVERNYGEAIAWFRKAAKQGNPSAMFNLGASYYNGEGLPVDEKAAYGWFSLAAEAGSVPAQDGVERLGKSLLPEDRAQSMRQIAGMYLTGVQVPKSMPNALKWAQGAAEDGNTQSMLWLAEVYQEGNGVPQDLARGKNWCDRAAALQSGPGMFCLGLIYREGKGVAKDLPGAAKWFSRAVEQGHSQAAFELSQMYLSGEGVRADRKKAFFYLLLSATSGYGPAVEGRDKLQAEMSTREVEAARKEAARWVAQHRSAVVLRRPLN
jgi:TPR repeat protein